MISQGTATILEEFPQLQRFSNRLRLIKQLKQDASQEDSLEHMRESYDTVLRLSEKLYAEVITYYMDESSKQFQQLVETCNERMRIIDMLEDMLKKAYGLNDEKNIVALIKKKRHLKIVKK